MARGILSVFLPRLLALLEKPYSGNLGRYVGCKPMPLNTWQGNAQKPSQVQTLSFLSDQSRGRPTAGDVAP